MTSVNEPSSYDVRGGLYVLVEIQEHDGTTVWARMILVDDDVIRRMRQRWLEEVRIEFEQWEPAEAAEHF